MAKLNQKLIAERLDLSTTTVSRCFTNHPKINPETRAKVFQLAAEMGYSYTIQRNASSKKPTNRKKIAVIVGVKEKNRGESDIATELISGIAEKCAAEKLDFEVFYVDPTEFHPKIRARQIVKGVSCLGWKGVVLIYPLIEESVSNIMAKFPTVSVLEDYDKCDVDCINQDHVRGISRVMQRLYDLGHRKIGFLSWKYAVHAPWVERRLGAYVENIYRLGLELDPKLILNVKPHEQIPLETLADQVKEELANGVTAWVCAADHQAYCLYSDLKERGVSVPGDVSITGFDGIVPPAGLPQVTTIRIPFKDIGISAVNTLLRKIEQPLANRRNIQVSGSTIEGDTTTAPLKQPALAGTR